MRDAWAIVSDTQATNRASGLRPFEYEDHPEPDGTSRRTFRTRIKNVEVEGEEFTASWEYPRRFEIRRTYDKGPFRSVVHGVEIEPDGDGSVVRSSFWMEGRGLLGKLFVWGFGREVLPLRREYLEDRLRAATTVETLPEFALSPVEPRRATSAEIGKVDALVRRAQGLFDTEIAERLGELVLTAPDDVVERIRPHALAHRWGTDRRETTDACLAATSVGLLKLRWDVICPHCRGDKSNLASLADVPAASYCPSCNLDFDVDLDRVLEVVFEPHPDIRRVEPGSYCQAGPGTTPHVLYQRLLEPNEEWTPRIDVPAGRYRIRVTGTDDVRWLRADDEAEATTEDLATLYVNPTGLAGEDVVLRPGAPADLFVRNRTTRRVLVAIEDARWADDALAGCELVADQRFRDLFSDQMLAGGIALSVQSVTILFTDLVGSTAMYSELGDARAFRLVWNHFDVLKEIVRDSRGATVKTIGDAVMAAFVHPDDAMRAAHELHVRLGERLEAMGHEYKPVRLKSGLHEGPCIVVTLNDRLDYFGQTVNTAARVEACSEGGDIVVTRHVSAMTDACAVLRDRGWFAEPFERQLKGLEHPLAMFRLRPL